MSVASTIGAGLQLVIHNATGVTLPAVQDFNSGTPATVTLLTTPDFALNVGGSANQLHLQIFPSGSAFPDVVTLMVSTESPQSGVLTAVGQAFTGAG